MDNQIKNKEKSLLILTKGHPEAGSYLIKDGKVVLRHRTKERTEKKKLKK